MKRIRSWWLAAAACAVLAAALLLPQRLLQQKLDRVTETDFPSMPRSWIWRKR